MRAADVNAGCTMVVTIVAGTPMAAFHDVSVSVAASDAGSKPASATLLAP